MGNPNTCLLQRRQGSGTSSNSPFSERPFMASILVVDDENLVRGIVEEILTSQGHEVIQATSGNEAIKMCGERTFDLVISDLSMPLMNGFDLISALRRLQKNLPVLAISGVYTGDLLKAVKLLGAKAILEKPFGPDNLKGAVDKILAKRMET